MIQPLTINERELLKTTIKNPTNLWVYAWQYLSCMKDLSYEIKEGSLLVYNKKGNLMILPQPLKINLINVPVVFSDGLKIEGFQRIKKDEDYVYDNQEFVDLNGKKWKNIRNSITRAKKDGLTYEEIKGTEEDKILMTNLTKQWKEIQEKKYWRLLDAVYTRNAISNFKELELWGGILKDKGVPVGYSVSGELNKDISFCFISKTLNLKWFYSDFLWYSQIKQNLERGYKFTNYAGTISAKNLRFYKEKLNPCDKIPLYRLEPKK